jgi:hypothetical protein
MIARDVTEIARAHAGAGGSPAGIGTMTPTTLPPRDEIRPDAPPRLAVAAAVERIVGPSSLSGKRLAGYIAEKYRMDRIVQQRRQGRRMV